MKLDIKNELLNALKNMMPQRIMVNYLVYNMNSNTPNVGRTLLNSIPHVQSSKQRFNAIDRDCKLITGGYRR